MNIIQEREALKTITSMVEEIQLTLKKEQNLVVGEDEIYKILEISQNDLETPSELRMVSESLTEEFEKDGFSELAENINALKYRESFYNL